MKNKSLNNPFPTFSDKMFDGNKDGKLDAIETAFRDAHLYETSQKKLQTEERKHPVKPAVEPDKTPISKSNEKSPSAGLQLFTALLVIVILIGAFAFAIYARKSPILSVGALAGAIALVIFLLKDAGMYSSK